VLIQLFAVHADRKSKAGTEMAEQILSVRVQGVSVTDLARPWAPLDLGAKVAAAVTGLCKRAIQPGMPRMSNEWLVTHDRFGGRRWND
jgi:hypothetical protein